MADKTQVNIVTDGDVSAVYTGGLKIAKVGGTEIYIPDEVVLKVTVSTQDGVEVTGQTVYVHEGDSAEGPVLESKPYENATVEFVVPKGMQYFVTVSDTLEGHFSPTTATGYADATTEVKLVYSDVSHVTVLSEIPKALAAIGDVEKAKELFVTGNDWFDDTWTDYDATATGDAKTYSDREYDEGGTRVATYASNTDANGHPIYYDPWVITDIQEVEDEDGETHIAAVLMRKYCGKYGIVFDAPNTELATEETAQAGVYYYGWANEYSETTTYAKDVVIQYGGYLYSSLVSSNVGNVPTGATDSYWKLITTTPSTYTSYSTGGLTLLSSLKEGDALPTTYVKIFKNAYSDTSLNIVPYGHNRYETSAIRQYLNSSGEKGTWWKQQHIGQTKPSSAASYSGYERGCSEEILSYAKAAKRNVMSNTKCDGGATYTVCDKFFLPAVPEMYGTDNAEDGENQRKYWTAITGYDELSPSNNDSTVRGTYALNEVRKMCRVSAKNSAAAVWLRSAYRGNSYNVLVVSSGGGLVSNGAYYALAPAPACVIY